MAVTIYLPSTIGSRRGEVIDDCESYIFRNGYKITDEVRAALSFIDEGTFIDEMSFIDRFGFKLPTHFMSTGCKIVIAVCNYPDVIFNVQECGRNAIDFLLRRNSGNIFMPELFDSGSVYFGNLDECDIVVGDRHFTDIDMVLNGEIRRYVGKR